MGRILFTVMTKMTKSVQTVILKKGSIVANTVGVTTWTSIICMMDTVLFAVQKLQRTSEPLQNPVSKQVRPE